MSRIGSYIEGAQDVLFCPDDIPPSSGSSFGLNAHAWRFVAQDATRIVLLDYKQTEARVVGQTLPQLDAQWPVQHAARHYQKVNATFYDGHVAAYEPRKIDPRLCDYYMRYWRPAADSNIELLGCTNSGETLPAIPLQTPVTTSGGTSGGASSTTTGGTTTGGTTTSTATTTTTTGTTTGASPAPNLILSITDSVDPVQAGGQVAYTITVTNSGTAGATGVTVTYPIPTGTSYVAPATVSQGSAAFANSTVTANLGNLAVGATATVTATVSVPVSATGPLNSTANVASGPSDTEYTDVDSPPPGCDPPRNSVCTAKNEGNLIGADTDGRLYAHYTFDDPGDWGKDTSGRGNHVSNMPNLSGITDDPERCKVISYGTEQNGQGMFIPIAVLNGSTHFTLAFWYKQVKTPCQLGSRVLHGLKWTNNPSHADMNLLRYSLNQNSMGFNYHHCAAGLGSVGWEADSTWNHYAVAFTTNSPPYGGACKAYRNGAVTSSPTWMFYYCGGSHCPQCYVGSNTNFDQGESSLAWRTDLSGKNAIAPGTAMSGRFDDIRIYRGQLSDSDINNLYLLGKKPSPRLGFLAILMPMNCKNPATISRMFLAAILCIASSGCWRSETKEANPPLSGGVPTVQESLDDIRARMAGLIHVENNKHHTSSPEEFDAWRLKALIKLDEIRRIEGVEGFRQTPVQKTGSQQGVVDATSKQIAWRASTCWNPTCIGKGKGGGPLVFVKQFENASVGPDGKLNWRTLKEEELPSATICPVCGLLEFIRPYDEPKVEIRRKQLAEELGESRRIRAEAEAARQLVPAGVRTPTEIMKEVSQLPKLFLVPNGG